MSVKTCLKQSFHPKYTVISDRCLEANNYLRDKTDFAKITKSRKSQNYKSLKLLFIKTTLY